ncbi:MAG: hypothetical protein AB8G99_08985, partial [Planctomycetaceae bacterium]
MELLYLLRNGKTYGPFPEAKVRRSYEAGALDNDTRGSKEADGPWTDLSNMFPQNSPSDVYGVDEQHEHKATPNRSAAIRITTRPSSSVDPFGNPDSHPAGGNRDHEQRDCH